MRKLIFVLAIIPINCCPDRFGNVHVELWTIPRVQKQKTGDTINNGFDIKFCANFNGVLQAVVHIVRHGECADAVLGLRSLNIAPSVGMAQKLPSDIDATVFKIEIIKS